jgi:hypothetical protein
MNILDILRERAKDYDCGVCGTNHSRSEISVLGRREGAWVVKVVCSKCETNITLLVYVGDKSRSDQSRSDQSRSDQSRADQGAVGGAIRRRSVALPPKRERRPPLTLDDVIDAHDVLESFAGDVNTLFAPRGKVRSSTDIS